MEKTLPEVCIIQYGFPFDSSKFCSAEGVPLVRIRDVVRGYSETYTTEIAGENYIVNDGDLLIGMDGEFNIAYWKGGRAYLNQRVCRLIPREDVDRDYIFYYMPQALKAIEDATPFVTVKHLSAKQLSKILIPLPDMREQQRISAVLRSVDRVIAMRKKELDELNNLVKSRFIELFGDADRFEAAPLDDNVVEMFIGPFGSSLKNECFVAADQGYCMVYEQKHAIKKTMDVDTRYIDEKKYKELHRFTVQGGDIIVSCRGTIGETFIIPEGAPFGIMHPSIMKIRLKASAYNRVFFNHLLQIVLDRHAAEASGSGVKMAITATALGKEYFILPPMELQEQFAAFVEQTDKSKLAVQKGLQELEILKKSLMQQYFG